MPPQPGDEFEALLRDCHDRLARIDLRLPELDKKAPQDFVIPTLDPAPAPLPPPPAQTFIVPPLDPPPAANPPVSAHVPEPAALPPTPTPTPVRRGEITIRPRIAPTAISSSRPRIPLPLAAGALIGALIAVWLAHRSPSDLALEVDGAQALAIRPEHKDLLVAKDTDLLSVNLEGKTLAIHSLNGVVADLTWNQGSLWAIDGRSPSVVERRDANPEKPTVFRLNHVPNAIFARDKYLWTSEKDGRAIHQFLISRSIIGVLLQPLDLYVLPGLNPETFAIDDAGTLWLVDSSTHALYQLRAGGVSYRPIASTPLSPLIGPGGRVRSLTIDGSSAWLLVLQGGGTRAVLHRIALRRLKWTPL